MEGATEIGSLGKPRRQGLRGCGGEECDEYLHCVAGELGEDGVRENDGPSSGEVVGAPCCWATVRSTRKRTSPIQGTCSGEGRWGRARSAPERDSTVGNGAVRSGGRESWRTGAGTGT